ncbi:hypothetical protein BJ170DRAFT_683513 [Xylariales sp. AK1849]|nr:hypothetical protein BJ170DRAFT_683513 [Xylariales sp. AK1849]
MTTSDRRAQAASQTVEADPHVLYFAYGSNLSTTQMRERCPSSVPVGLVHLPGYTWLINERQYANIVANSESASSTSSATVSNSPTAEPSTKNPGVFGVLYRLPPQDEEYLDMCEGVPFAYEKRFVDVTLRSRDGIADVDGEGNLRKVSVLAYIDVQNVGEAEPKQEYVGRMNRGIKEAGVEWGLPGWFVKGVMRRFIPEV